MAFQAKLVTKLEEYSVEDAVIELKNSVGKTELTQVVVSLLKQLDRDDLDDIDKKRFDFIVGGRLLRTSIADHFELYADEFDAREILNEKLVEIEYTIPLESPKPADAFQHNDWVRCVDLNETHMVTGSYDNSISIFSLRDKKKLANITDGHNQPITAVRIINPNHGTTKTKSNSNSKSVNPKNCIFFISSSHDETCRLWRFDTIKMKCDELIVFRGHKRSVDCLDVQQDLLVTGGYDKTIKIWSSLPEADDTELGITGVSNGNSTYDDEDEDDTLGSNTRSTSKNVKRKKVKAKQESSKNIDGNAQLSRNPTITLTGHKDGVRGVKWLNNGTGPDSLASCSLDGLILLWDVETGSETKKFVSAKPMLGLDHNENSNLLLTASCDRFVRLWDTRLPDESRASAVFSSHAAWVSSVAFSSTSGKAQSGSTNHFVSGAYDNLVKLWDLRSPKACLYDLIGHHDRVFDVNCNNAKFVASGSADSTVRLYATQ